MALIVRMVSGAAGQSIEKRLKNGRNKVAIPDGGRVEIVDEATGLHVQGKASVDAQGNSVLSFDGPRGPITLELSGSVGGGVPLFSDASFAEDALGSSARGGQSVGAAAGSGSSIPPVLLGVFGLAGLGGIAAAVAGSKDKTPPNAPAALDLAAADDTGASNTDNVTSQTSALTISGSAEAGARVELFDGATSIGTATADASGNFSVDVSLSAGAHSITAKATDPAGNVGPASGAFSVTVDTSAPAAPTALDLAAADDTGASSTDNVTSQTSALTISGGAEAGARVELFDGATSIGTATADASGNFRVDVSLSAGAHSITAKATDTAGNVGPASGTISVTVDTTSPTPAVLSVDRASQTLAVRFDENLASAGGLATGAFSVTTGGVANAVTSYAVNGDVLVLTLAGPIRSGTTEITYADPTVANDAAALQDAAGNDVGTFTLALGVLADGFVRGARIFVESTSNGQVVRTDTGVVTDANGNFYLPYIYAGRTLVAVGGVNIDTGIANTIDYRAPAGSSVINPLTTLVQAVIDASPVPITANAASQAVASALGVVLPSGQSITRYDPISNGNTELQRAAAQVAAIATVADRASSSNEGSVFANIAAQLSAAARSGATVDLASSQVVSAALVGTTAAGNTSLVNQIQASVVAIENASTFSGIASAQAATLDRTAPATPSQLDLISADDTGVSTSDNITSKRSFSGTVTFNNSATDGTAVVAGDTIQIIVAGQVIASRVVTDADLSAGRATVAFTNVPDGTYAAYARILDKAGNESALSPSLNLVVDGTAPAAPTISFADLVDTGSTEAAHITTDKAFNIELVGAEVGTSIAYEVSTNGGTTWTSTTAAQSNLADGAYSFRATLTDAAGNTSSSNVISMTVDTTNPSVPVVTTQTTSSTSPVVTGTANLAAGELLTITVNGATYENVAVTNGVWSVNTGTALPKAGTSLGAFNNGSYDVVATVVDRAGNVSTDATSREVTVTPTFTVSESNGVVTFAGTATGAISVSYGADGAATFARSGITASTTVANLNTKSISGAVELNVNVTGAATAGDDIINISAPQATAIRFSGDAGAGVDQLIVSIADKSVGVADSRAMLIDTSGITNAENIRFGFDATAANDLANRFDNDVLTLTPGSVISSGFTTFEVRSGTVDYSAATLPQNIRFDFRSGGVSTLAQFRAADSFVSLTDSGSVVIALASSELPALRSFLAQPGALKLIGFNVGLKIDGGAIINLSTTTDNSFADLKGALSAISYPGIVGLTAAIADLQGQIAANDSDIATLVNNVSTVSASVSTLNVAVNSKDAAQTAALNAAKSTFNDAITAVSSNLTSAVSTLNGRITTVAADLQSSINANTVIDTQQATLLAGLRADLTTAQNSASALATTVASNNTAQTAALASARAALEAADATLTSTIESVQSGLLAAINGLETSLKDGVSTDFDTFKEVATKLGTLGAAINLLDASDTTDGSVAKSVKVAFDTLTTNYTSAISTAISTLESSLKDGVSTNYDTFKEVATKLGSLQDAIDTLNGSDTVAGSVKQQILAAKTALEAAISDLADTVADEIAAREDADALLFDDSSQNGGVATTNSIVGLKAAIDALAELVDDSTSELASDVYALNGKLFSLVDHLPGRGVLMSVEDASELQGSDDDDLRIFLTNYRLLDTAAHILALSPTDAVVTNAKAVLIESGDILSSAQATKLITLGVDLADSTYNVEDTVANLVAYGSFPAQVLANATDVHGTGTANFTQALTLLGLGNRGTTTIDAVKVSYAQAANLPVDNNDVIGSLTVSGLDLSNKSTIVDLTGYHVSTAITFVGGRGNETVVVTAASTETSEGDVGVITLNGGKGNDDFYVIESVDGDGEGVTSYVVTGSAFNGGLGNDDTLTVRGQVDLSGVTISGIEALYLEEGSPSAVTLNPEQLLVFGSITGAVDEEGNPVSSIAVVAADGSTSADISDLPIVFANTPNLQVGANVTLTLSLSQIGSLNAIVAVEHQQAGQIVPVLGSLSGDVDLSNVFVDIDLSNADFYLDNGNLMTADGHFAVILPVLASGQTLSLDVNDLVGQLVLGGDGTLLIKNDFAFTGEYSTVDLTEVTADISFDDYRNGDDSIYLSDFKALVLRPDQANEKTISGDGLVAISGDVLDDATVDLRDISAGLTFSDDPEALNAIALGDNSVLKLNAYHADLLTITSDYNTSLVGVYRLEYMDDGDFSAITGANVQFHVSDDATLSFVGDLGDPSTHEIILGDNAEMAFSFGQADGRSITGSDSSSVTIIDLKVGADLSHVADDINVTAEVSSDLDLSQNTQIDTIDTFRLVDGTNGRINLSEFAGHTVDLNLTSDGDRDTYLTVYDANGRLVAFDDDGGDYANSFLSEIFIQDGYYAVLSYYDVVADGASVSDFSDDVLYFEVYDYDAEDTSVLFEDTLAQNVSSSLTLNADQADSQSVIGTGDVYITGLTGNGAGQLSADLTSIDVSGSVTIEIVEGADLSDDVENLANVDEIVLAGSHEIDLSGATIQDASTGGSFNEPLTGLIDSDPTQKFYFNNPSGFAAILQLASAKAVNGFVLTTGNDFEERDPATVTILGSNDGENFETIIEGFRLHLPSERSASSGLYTFDNTTSYSYYKILFPTVKSGGDLQLGEMALFESAAVTVTLDAGNADGRSITEKSPSTLIITGNDDSALENVLVSTLDVRTATGNLSFQQEVLADHSILLTAAQAGGQEFYGDGTIVVSGDVTTGTVNLTVIDASVVFDDNDISIAENAQLDLRLDQADDVEIDGLGVVVLSAGAAQSDTTFHLGAIAVDIDLTPISVDFVPDENGSLYLESANNLISLPTLEDGQDLLVTVAQANGLVVEGGTGTVNISGNVGEDTLVDLTGIADTTDLTFRDSLSDSGVGSITIGANSEVSLSAVHADGLSVGGDGAVRVTRLEDAAGGDFSGLTAAATLVVSAHEGATFTGELAAGQSTSFEIGADAILALGAADASSRTITGTGTLEVVDILATTDLSNVVAPSAGTVAFNGFTDFNLAFDHDVNSTAELDTETQVVTLTDTNAAGGAGASTASMTVEGSGQIRVHYEYAATDGFSVYTPGYGGELAVRIVRDGVTTTVQLNDLGGSSYSAGPISVTQSSDGAVVSGDIILNVFFGDEVTFTVLNPHLSDSLRYDVKQLTLSDARYYAPGDEPVTGLEGVVGHITHSSVDDNGIFDISGNAGSGDIQGVVTTYILEDSYTLRLTAGQADGLVVVEGDSGIDGFVDVVGAVGTGSSTDLRGLGADVDLTFGDDGIEVETDGVLILKAEHASGKTIFGNGTTYVAGDVFEGQTVDLRGLTTTNALFQTDGEATNAISVAGLLKVNAAMLSGAEINPVDSVSGDIHLYNLHDVEDTFAFGAINGDHLVIAYVNSDTNLTHNSAENLAQIANYQVSEAVTLTLSASEATGKFMGGVGNVTVERIESNTNLNGISGDLSVTATVAGSIDVTSNGGLASVDNFSIVDVPAINRIDLSDYAGQTVGLFVESRDSRDALFALYHADGTLVDPDDLGAYHIEDGDYLVATYAGIEFGPDTVSSYSDDVLTVAVEVPTGDGNYYTDVLYNDSLSSKLTISASQIDGRAIFGGGGLVVTNLSTMDGELQVNLSGVDDNLYVIGDFSADTDLSTSSTATLSKFDEIRVSSPTKGYVLNYSDLNDTDWNDAGHDMYDTANSLAVDGILQSIWSTDNTTTPTSESWGNYVFRTFKSGTVLSVTDFNGSSLAISGDVGADGNGHRQTTELTGFSGFRVFVDQIYGAGDPSVNKLIITNAPDPSFTASTDTNEDSFSVNDLDGATFVIYVLLAGSPDIDRGYQFTEDELRAVVDALNIGETGVTDPAAINLDALNFLAPPAEVSLDVNTVGDTVLSGTGIIKLTGSGDIDLNAVKFTVTQLDVSAVDGAVTLPDHLLDDQHLVVRDAQADGAQISTGTLHIAGDITQDVDLTGIGSWVTFQDGDELRGQTNVADGATLTAVIHQISGQAIGGAGQVVVGGEFYKNIDLSRLTADLDLTNVVDVSGDPDTGRLTNIDGYQILLPEVLDFDITLTIDQANNAAIYGSEDSVTHIKSDFVHANVDLTSIQNGLALAYGNLTIDDGVVLLLRADQADGMYLDGPGTLFVTGSLLDGTTDLINASVGSIVFDIDHNAIYDTEITVLNGRTLKIGADQVGDMIITVAGNLDVYLGTGDEDFDFDALINATTGSVTVHIIDDVDLSESTSFLEMTNVVIHDGHVLTLNAEQADGLTITQVDGDASVHVTDLADYASADLSYIDVNSVTAAVDSSVTFTGDLGSAIVTVASDATMTIAASLASAHEINGGHVVITDLGSDYYDLSGIGSEASATVSDSVTLDVDTDLGGLEITVGDSAVLTLRYDQADLRLIDGAGHVNVTNNIPDQADITTFDLTGVTATLTFLDPDSSETGNGSIDLGANVRLVLTPEQAHGQTITGSSATVSISGNVASGAEGEPNIVDLRGITSGLSFAIDDDGDPVGIAVGNYAVLQLLEYQANGATITGAGAVEIHGLSETTNLSNVGAGIEITGLSGVLAENEWNSGNSSDEVAAVFNAEAGTVNFHIPANNLAQVSISPGAGTFSFHYDATVAGSWTGIIEINGTLYDSLAASSGDIAITLAADDIVKFVVSAPGNESEVSLGFSNLSFTPVRSDTQVTVFVSEGIDASSNSHLATVDSYSIVAGEVLSLSAAQANGVASSGGTVRIVGDVPDMATDDHSGIPNALFDLTGITSDLTFDDDNIEVIGEYSRLAVRPDQLQQSSVVISGNGSLVIVGDVTSGTLDLTAHTVVAVSFADTVSDEDAIDVAAGAALVMRTGQADSQSVTGQGTVYISGNVGPDGYVDLTNINAAISFDDQNDVTPSITILDGGELVLDASRLTADMGTIFGPGTLSVTGDVFSDTDFSAVDPSANLSLADSNVVSFPEVPQLNANRTLTVTSSQVNGVTVVQDYAHIKVIADTYVDGETRVLDSDLNYLSAASVDMYVFDSMTNFGNLGQVKVHLQGGSIFTLSAALADGVTIDGEGTTNVTGDVTHGTVDLTHVTSSSLSFYDGDTNAIDVAAGATLLVAADAVAQAGASAVDVTGGGSVGLRNATVATHYDVTIVESAGASLYFRDAGTLNADTVLRSIDGGVSFVSLYDNALISSVDVTTMSAAQASGIDFTLSDGALHVTASDGAQTLSGTLHNDVFEGGGTGEDTVNLGTDGGSDSLKWAPASANQMVIHDFFATGSDSENDILDFSNLSLHNPNHTGTYEGLVSDPDVDTVPNKLTADVVGLTDLFAGNTQRSVELLFKSANNFLNKLVDVGTGGHQTEMVFLIANSSAEDANINVWHWVDGSNGGSNDGNLTWTEVTLLGTVNGLGAGALTTTNFHDNIIG